MRNRLRSAGFLGALLALIGPELAITTATVVLTPAVAEAQVGGVHRRTRRRTRRRTAAVVHTADMNQAAAQQQQQSEANQQSLLPGQPAGSAVPGVTVESETRVASGEQVAYDSVTDGEARAPPGVDPAPAYLTGISGG